MLTLHTRAVRKKKSKYRFPIRYSAETLPNTLIKKEKFFFLNRIISFDHAYRRKFLQMDEFLLFISI